MHIRICRNRGSIAAAGEENWSSEENNKKKGKKCKGENVKFIIYCSLDILVRKMEFEIEELEDVSPKHPHPCNTYTLALFD
jgi:hypothetical protein